jgi:serine/threonine protein kinase
MASPTSCPEPGLLKQLLDESLPRDQQAPLKQHLETCADCQKTLEGLVAGKESWAELADQLGRGRPDAGQAAARDAGSPTAPTAEEEPSLDFLSPAEKPGSLGRLGHYDILEVIGKGGMGIVLRAFDGELHRVVAIKVMAAQLATSGTARQRFRREAQAAAAVSHDHVVTIHAVAEANGSPYLVMQFISGLSLQERIDRGGPLQLAETVRIGMQTAAGLAAAHAQGLVHRDIKPANILLENGIERVKITDFGLARAAADASLTQSGVVAGTPQYMSPEQAEGKAIDHRSDLFSLGSVLYAMCTGRAPFRASGSMAVLKRVCEGAPRPIRETNPDIPDWLVALIDKLHAKDPAARYQSAAEVAALLNQHLAHLQHPSLATLPAERAQVKSTKPIPRRRVVAGALVFCLVAGFAWMEAASVTGLRSALIDMFQSSGTDASATNQEQKPDSGSATALVDFPVGEVRKHFWPDRRAYFADFSPDGKYYVATGERWGPSTVRVWELASGKLVMEVTGYHHARFTHDSKRLIVLGLDTQLHVWDLATHKEIARFGEYPDWSHLSLSPDDKHLLSCNDGAVRLWDFAEGKETAQLESDNKMLGLCFCPDGKRFFTFDKDGIVIRLWDLAQRKEIRHWQQPESQWGPVAFLPGGQRFITVGTETVFFWDMAADKETQALRLVGKRGGAAISPDRSRLLYTVAHDPMARLIELPHGKEIATFPMIQISSKFVGIAFSPDGRFAVVADWDMVYLWRLPDPPVAGKK